MLAVLLAPSNIFSLSLGTLFFAASGKKPDQRNLFALGVALFFASVNSTKLLQGDLLNYYHYSEEISKGGFLYAFLFANEPLYYLLNWFFVAVLGWGFAGWVFAVSFSIYYMSLKALQLFMEDESPSKGLQLAVLLFFAFSPIIFSQSAHLLRQYLASALALLGLARYIKTGRWNIFQLLSPLTHVSSAIFLLVPLMGMLPAKSFRSQAVLGVIFPILTFFVFRSISSFASVLPLPSIVKYAMLRAGQTSFHELTPLGTFPLLFVILSIVTSSSTLLLSYRRIRSGSTEALGRRSAAYAFQFSISVMILVLSGLGLVEPAVRMFQYVLFLAPISLVAFARISPVFKAFVFLMSYPLAVFLFLVPLRWQYADFSEVLTYPSLYYLLEGIFN